MYDPTVTEQRNHLATTCRFALDTNRDLFWRVCFLSDAHAILHRTESKPLKDLAAVCIEEIVARLIFPTRQRGTP